MNFARFFVLGILLITSTAWPVAAYSDPAVSLQHLLTDEDCESVSQLLGDWEPKGDLSGIWTIKASGDRKYRLIQKEGESDTSNKAAFDICVAHVGGYLFFDATYQTVRPDGKALLGEDDNLFWIPLHLIGRLDVNDDALRFRLLGDDWLQDALKSGRLHLTSSQDDEGYYLLTAPSKELKEFAERFASDPRAFSYAEEFEHISSDVAKRKSSHQALLTDPERSVATNYSQSDVKESGGVERTFTPYGMEAEAPLERGRLCGWKVAAQLGAGGFVSAPTPPSPEAKVKILDQRKADEITHFQQNNRESHVVLSILYGQAGLLEKGEYELEQVPKGDPDYELCQNLLKSIQEIRHPRH